MRHAGRRPAEIAASRAQRNRSRQSQPELGQLELKCHKRSLALSDDDADFGRPTTSAAHTAAMQSSDIERNG